MTEVGLKGENIMNKIKRIGIAIIPILFATALASLSQTILRKIGIPGGWWYFVIFMVLFAWVMNNKGKIFK